MIPCIQNVAPGEGEEIVTLDVALYGIGVVGADVVGQTEDAVEGEGEEEDFIKPVDMTIEYYINCLQLLMRSEKAILIPSGYRAAFLPF